MKKIVITSVVLILLAIALGNIPQQPQPSAFLVKHSSANDTALAKNTSSWAACDDWVTIPQAATTLKIAFYAYNGAAADPDGQAMTYILYVADRGGNAQIVNSGAGTVGKSQLSHNPVTMGELNSGAVSSEYCWVDTLTSTSSWSVAPTLGNEAGADGVAYFIFDRESAYKIMCHFAAIAGSEEYWCVAYWY